MEDEVQLDPVATVARITALEILTRQLMVIQLRILDELGQIDLTPAYVRELAEIYTAKVDASTITNPAQFQQYQQAQDKLSGVLGRLMLIQEKYPDLKSNENFLALQSQLEGTENRIAIARHDYNDAVQAYNTTLITFPQVIWAKTAHGDAKPMQLFTAAATAQSAPTVSFDTTPPPAPAGTAPGSPPPEIGRSRAWSGPAWALGYRCARSRASSPSI